MNKDMTKGSPSKLLWAFAMPMLLSMVFQQLYSVCDSIIAGNFINKDALAAVGASYPITMIFIAIGTGANAGCAVIISQLFGAKEYERLKTAVFTSLISLFGLSAVLTATGLIFSDSMLTFLETPESIFADSKIYLDIYIWGLFFMFLYNICNAIFTALGDSRTPLIFLIISSLSNIGLDLLFVIVFKMGVAGVAWATFICQGVCSLAALAFALIRVLRIKTTEKYSIFSFRMLGEISRIAIPSILQQSFVSVGNLLIQRLINSYGDNTIAGYSAAIKLNTFAVSVVATVTNSISSFTAQNAGAKNTERIKAGFRHGVIMILCIVLPFTAVYNIFAKEAISLFMDAEEAGNIDAINIGVNFIHIVSPFYISVALKLVADAILRGTASMKLFMVATFTDLLLRVILAYILSGFYDTTGIWISWPIGWTIAAIMSVGFYLSGHWKRHVLG